MEIRLKLPFLGQTGEDSPVMGRDKELLVSQLHGKFYSAAKRGRMFSQTTTPLGLAIPLYTATGIPGVVLWNHPGSGVNVIPKLYVAAYASGTAAYTALGLMVRKKVGGPDLATGSEITAFAETTPENALIGAGETSKIKSSNAGTITVTAGVAAEFVRTIGSLNLEAQTGTAHGTVVNPFEFDDSIIVPPGNLVWIAATLASVALYAQTLVWEEEDA